jgi:hypothetical protein
MFNCIDIYSFINMRGCVGRSHVHSFACPGVYIAGKTTLPIYIYVYTFNYLLLW